MNYETYIKHEYTYNVPLLQNGHNRTLFFYSDGSGGYVDDYDFNTDYGYDLEAYLYYVINYSNRNYSDRGQLIAFELFDSNNGVASELFLTEYVDYVVHGGSYIYNGVHYASDTYPDIGNGVSLQNYPTQNNFNFSDFTYGYYANQLNNTKAVYDLTSIKSNTNYYTDVRPIRGENISVYNSVILKHTYSDSECYFAYGQPYYDTREEALETGYSNGYQAGHTNGFNEGYDIGLNSHVDENTYTAFGYIGTAFNAVNGILALEVLPHITLGLCFSIPLVLVLIMTIFRLVKK